MPIIAILGTVYSIVINGFFWQTLVFAFIFAVSTGIGITAGYHRLFAHKAYKAAWPVRLVLAILGTASIQGSILDWCTDHRNHHRYTDQDEDPYTVKKGFWYAHIGWIFTLDESARNFNNVKDLMDDPIIRFQHKYFLPLAILSSFGLPTFIAWCWGDPWGGLFMAGALRLTLNHHFTFFINSLCHYWGKLTYERATARDNWLLSLVTYGEGFHNFHHKFSIDYRNGIRWYHFDPSKWLIYSLSKVGLTTHLKRINKDVILQHQLDMQMQQVLESGNVCETKLQQWLTPLLEQIKTLQLQIKQMKTEYQRLQKEKWNSMSLQVNEYKHRIAEYRKQIRLAKKARRQTLKVWVALIDALQTKKVVLS
jgi:stearoyl-CoA desaturase (delta-9 desaturase)